MQKKTLIKNIIRTLLEQPLRDMKLQKKKKRYLYFKKKVFVNYHLDHRLRKNIL